MFHVEQFVLAVVFHVKQKRSKIGIITASNKKEHKQACKERGADFYVEKADDWQKNLIEMCTRLNEENN